MIAPAERVRVAIAPSIVIRFSSLRLPLMLKPPLVRLSGWKLLKLLPRTPGLSSARLIGLRPFSIRSWICLLSIVFDIWPVLVCSVADSAVTVTVSSSPPVSSITSRPSLAAASRRMPVSTNFLKPVISIVSV